MISVKTSKVRRFGALFDIENFTHIYRRTSAELLLELGIITQEIIAFFEKGGLYPDYEHFLAFSGSIPGEIREVLKMYKWRCKEPRDFSERGVKGAQIADKLLICYVEECLNGNDEMPKHLALISGDGGFVKITRAMKNAGHRIYVFGWGSNRFETERITSEALKREANAFVSLETLIGQQLIEN